RTALAMVLLVAAIGVLSWGAEGARPTAKPQAAATVIGASSISAEKDSALSAEEDAEQFDAWLVALAVIVTCFSGFCYAASSVMIRRVAGADVPLSATIMVLSTTGLLSLGLITLWRIGWIGISATTGHEWTAMLLAGL